MKRLGVKFLNSFIYVIATLFMFPSPALTSVTELMVVPAKQCPNDMTRLIDGEACFFTQDWDSYAKGIKRSGCIMRIIYPNSERPIDYFIGKWVYEYNKDSSAWKEKKYAREVGYYQHDSQVGEWLTFDTNGKLIESNYYKPVENIPVYDCVPSE